MKVLIIEDDPAIAANLYDFLEGCGHTPDLASDGVSGLHLAVTQVWDAILLDLALPGMDGLTLCRRLREDAHRDTPVLMVTAKDELSDKLQGFVCGADDYLVKPFALEEVRARLAALTKRYRGQVARRVLHCADLRFDLATMRVERAGRFVKMPPKCLHLLRVLMQSPDRVFTHAELEAEVWGNRVPDSDSLRAHIYTLRHALTTWGGNDLIETVHGLGYRLVSDGSGAS